MAAMMEYRSTHWEISVTGSLAGAGGQPGVRAISMTAVTSDISKNSRFRIFFTTLCGREAVRLNGPGECSLSPA